MKSKCDVCGRKVEDMGIECLGGKYMFCSWDCFRRKWHRKGDRRHLQVGVGDTAG